MWQTSLKLSQKRQAEKASCRASSSMLREFVKLMGNASMGDWAWLASYDQRKSQLLEFEHSSKSVVPARDVPWPIVWFLARYSRKFIFAPGSLPRTDAIVQNMVLFEKKLAWRLVFRNEDKSARVHKKKVKQVLLWPELVAP